MQWNASEMSQLKLHPCSVNLAVEFTDRSASSVDDATCLVKRLMTVLQFEIIRFLLASTMMSSAVAPFFGTMKTGKKFLMGRPMARTRVPDANSASSF